MRIEAFPIEIKHEKYSATLIRCVGKNGETLGTAILRDTKKPNPWIADVCIAPKHRRKGYGKQLIEHAIGLSVKANAVVVRLWVHKKNTAAMACYKACGFIVADTGDEAWMMVRALK